MSINSLRRSGSAGSGIKSHWNTFYALLWRGLQLQLPVFPAAPADIDVSTE